MNKLQNPSTASKVLKTSGKIFKKGLKFLGGKSFGIAGMLMSTTGTADIPHQNTNTQKRGNIRMPSGKSRQVVTDNSKPYRKPVINAASLNERWPKLKGRK